MPALRTPAVAVALALIAGPAASAAPPVLGHVVEASFDLDAHSVSLRDRLTVPPGLEFLRLGADLDYRLVSPAPAVGAPVLTRVEAGPDEGGTWQRLDLSAAGLAQGGELVLEARAVFHAPVDQVAFSRENVGGEIAATISAEGVYLSSLSGWLATAEGAFGTYDLTLDTPAGYETLTQGRLVERQQEGGRLRTRWVSGE
ncbi:hypothetical protein FJ250_10235, partial [bacterium]|nr:hypothetical protein [bacterium]